jgi:hypothetical protein
MKPLIAAATRLGRSPPRRRDRRRELGDRHAAARRNLFNRVLGQLYHCLQVGQTFSESKAFRSSVAAAA